MVQKINVLVYSEKDIKEMVEKEFSKKMHSYDIILNNLNQKIVDLDRIISKFNGKIKTGGRNER